MATVETIYMGGLRTEATHVQSGTKIVTDAPTDNHGKGESFSPTDLVSAALGSCMMTLMGIAADTHGINVDGTRLSITKVMAADPRRIGEIVIDVHFPSAYEPKQRKLLENAGRDLSGRQDAASGLQADDPLFLRGIVPVRKPAGRRRAAK